MKPDIIFAVDVGGTFIKTCVIEYNIIIEETINQFDAKSNETFDKILDHFVKIINDLSDDFVKYKQSTDKNVNDPLYQKNIGIGFAFPGPFDYERGISYICGLNKFESLYGCNFQDELLKRLQDSQLAVQANTLKMLFENDGRLFGLGASTLYPNERLICLTIGTGLGSVFIDQGKIIKNDTTIPPEGYLFNQHFHNQPIDEQFSSRGIQQLAISKGITDETIEVKELACKAKKGDHTAINIFEEFGSNLAEMVTFYIKKFQPDRIVIGGQIAKSFNLFGNVLQNKLSQTNTVTNPLDHALHFTFIGIGQLFIVN